MTKDTNDKRISTARRTTGAYQQRLDRQFLDNTRLHTQLHCLTPNDFHSRWTTAAVMVIAALLLTAPIVDALSRRTTPGRVSYRRDYLRNLPSERAAVTHIPPHYANAPDYPHDPAILTTASARPTHTEKPTAKPAATPMLPTVTISHALETLLATLPPPKATVLRRQAIQMKTHIENLLKSDMLPKILLDSLAKTNIYIGFESSNSEYPFYWQGRESLTFHPQFPLRNIESTLRKFSLMMYAQHSVSSNEIGNMKTLLETFEQKIKQLTQDYSNYVREYRVIGKNPPSRRYTDLIRLYHLFDMHYTREVYPFSIKPDESPSVIKIEDNDATLPVVTIVEFPTRIAMVALNDMPALLAFIADFSNIMDAVIAVHSDPLLLSVLPESKIKGGLIQAQLAYIYSLGPYMMEALVPGSCRQMDTVFRLPKGESLCHQQNAADIIEKDTPPLREKKKGDDAITMRVGNVPHYPAPMAAAAAMH